MSMSDFNPDITTDDVGITEPVIDAPEPDAVTEPVADETTPPEPVSLADDEAWEIDPGRKLTRAEVRYLAGLADAIRDDEGLYRVISGYYAQRNIPTGQVEGADGPPTAPAPQPEDEDEITSLRRELGELRARVDSRTQAENSAAINRARASFQETNGLTAEEMEQVYTVTERLNVLPSLIRGVDPVTGRPSRPDLISALDRAFEIGMWTIPDMRSKFIQTQAKRRQADNHRKQKLAGIGGSSGSSPRNPAPVSMKDWRKEATQEAARMMGLDS